MTCGLWLVAAAFAAGLGSALTWLTWFAGAGRGVGFLGGSTSASGSSLNRSCGCRERGFTAAGVTPASLLCKAVVANNETGLWRVVRPAMYQKRRGAGGSGTQKLVYQKWPKPIFPSFPQ